MVFLLCVLLTNILPPSKIIENATDFALQRVLKLAIILLGAGISANVIYNLGTLPVVAIVVAIVTALGAASLMGRFLKVDKESTALIGAGSAICGASAVAAVAPLVKATKDQIATVLACIFSLNAFALILLPILGTWMNMDNVSFGIWAGVAVHDTASAVAAGFAYNEVSGEIATIVKLGRTLVLVPLLFLFALLWRPTGSTSSSVAVGLKRAVSAFPVFVVGFLAMAAASSLGLLGGAEDFIAGLGSSLILIVVAAVGLGFQIKKFTAVGFKVAGIGVVTFVAIAMSSCLVIVVGT